MADEHVEHAAASLLAPHRRRCLHDRRLSGARTPSYAGTMLPTATHAGIARSPRHRGAPRQSPPLGMPGCLPAVRRAVAFGANIVAPADMATARTNRDGTSAPQIMYRYVAHACRDAEREPGDAAAADGAWRDVGHATHKPLRG